MVPLLLRIARKRFICESTMRIWMQRVIPEMRSHSLDQFDVFLFSFSAISLIVNIYGSLQIFACKWIQSNYANSGYSTRRSIDLFQASVYKHFFHVYTSHKISNGRNSHSFWTECEIDPEMDMNMRIVIFSSLSHSRQVVSSCSSALPFIWIDDQCDEPYRITIIRDFFEQTLRNQTS